MTDAGDSSRRLEDTEDFSSWEDLATPTTDDTSGNAPPSSASTKIRASEEISAVLDEKVSGRSGSEVATSGTSAREAESAAAASASSRKDEANSLFECNICLDSPNDPVVSYCGHLFCWACIHSWMETRSRGHAQPSCPVCKAAVDRNKLVPLYGRNSKQQDPRTKIPPRPQAQRTEASDQPQGVDGQAPDFIPFPGFGIGNGGFHMSVGFGVLPFTVISSFFSLLTNQNGGVATGQPADQNLVSRAFLWIAVLCILWIVFY